MFSDDLCNVLQYVKDNTAICSWTSQEYTDDFLYPKKRFTLAYHLFPSYILARGEFFPVPLLFCPQIQTINNAVDMNHVECFCFWVILHRHPTI